MEQNVIQQNMWNMAGKAGLVLGAVSAAYLFLTQWLAAAQMPALLMTLVNMLLWALKFGGCIYLMILYLRKFSSENPDAERKDIFKAGMTISILSALVYSAFSFANIAFIQPDFFTEQMDTMLQQFGPLLDSNTLSELEKTMQNLPQITFFSNLIYCSIYGTILSYTISRYVIKQDPFAGYKTEE